MSRMVGLTGRRSHPVFPQQPTSNRSAGMSQTGHKRSSHSSHVAADEHCSCNPAFCSPARNRSRSTGRRNGRMSRWSFKEIPGSNCTKPFSPDCASVMRPRCAAAEAKIACESGNDGLKSMACLAQVTASAKRSACKCDQALTVCWLLVIPWSLIGGSAAVLLHVPQDWLLLVSGLIAVPLIIVRDRAVQRLAAKITA